MRRPIGASLTLRAAGEVRRSAGSSNFCGVEAAYGGEKRSKMHNSCG
jgi:hypothetical protein